jgi:nitrogen fixation/metabolism regulation signal transduction histidine kinase
MGSRLTVRLLTMFVLLAVLPVTVVFMFSIQALNKGIDSWFDVKIEQALDDALLLGRTSLDAIKQDLVKNAEDMAVELENSPDHMALSALNYLREKHGLSELTLFAKDGKIIASSSSEGPAVGSLVPDRPGDAVLSQIRQGLSYANLDPVSESGLRLRVVVPVIPHDVGAPIRILQVLQPLSQRYSNLGQSVQTTYAEYEKLVYLRGPLKFGFTLNLSLVALLTLLIALWAAIFFARRLVAPIRDLAQGTHAVAQGDYRTQIPVASKDEFGILVKSFNEMTEKIHQAQTELKHSQQLTELHRAYLDTVLTHMSSGVMSFDLDQRLRTHNSSANQILGVTLDPGEGKPLLWFKQQHLHLAPFIEGIDNALQSGLTEWQANVVLTGQLGKRTLILRGTQLPGPDDRPSGHVVVFDDVTALIQAQRDAAWSEVARRLAHEIKNPLTPIQLSAERIRIKHLDKLSEAERHNLDRATRTIIEQVDTLKSMVNAFSEYARPVQMQPQPVDLNDLVRDVVEMYKSGSDMATGTNGGRVKFKLQLDKSLPEITADPGRLRQVLHNLLLNASDALASNSNPLIRISTRDLGGPPPHAVELQISDNGPGFPPALLEHLFEPYVTNKEKGTGLGLAIVKKIVEEHHGELWAENLKKGGASITIRLPVSANIGTEASSPESAASRSVRQGRSI